MFYLEISYCDYALIIYVHVVIKVSFVLEYNQRKSTTLYGSIALCIKDYVSYNIYKVCGQPW